MNKQEFNAGKKAYQQPRMKVVEIDSSDIICTSTSGQDLDYHDLYRNGFGEN